jgi:hypothetical protein
MIDLNTLYENTEKIKQEDSRLNKYLFMGYYFKLDNYRIFTYNNFLHLLDKGYVVHPTLIDIVKKEGRCQCVFNIINNICVQVFCRSLIDRYFFSIKENLFFPYGIGMLQKDFRYGMPLVICEGIADRDLLAHCYPNVIAVANKRLNPFQMVCVKSLTNNIILSYDNDKTGQTSFYKDSEKLKKEGFSVKLLKHINKDAGDVVDYLMKGDTIKFDLYCKRYKNYIEFL